MMPKKKLSEVKADVARMLSELPDGWMEEQLKIAKRDPGRDLKTLEMLCIALEAGGKKHSKPKRRQPVAK